MRRAAASLAAQDGAGVRRDVLVGLAAPGLAVTMEAQDGHVLAVVSPAPGSAPAFAALTAREREVAALLADGRSNGEVAEALVITVGTVKDHVHSILGKTGLRTRAAVAAAWHGADQSA